MVRIAALALALAISGCGTVANFKDGHKGETKPYGGVKIAAQGFQEDLVAVALMWPFYGADVVFSAVGDTLTLPITVVHSISKQITLGINNYYFPKDDGRRYWYSDALGHESDHECATIDSVAMREK